MQPLLIIPWYNLSMTTIKARDLLSGDLIMHAGDTVLVQIITEYGNRVRLIIMYPDGYVVAVTKHRNMMVDLLTRKGV